MSVQTSTGAGPGIGGVRSDGLAVLGPRETALRDEIEAVVAERLREFGAAEVELPRMVRLADAASIDYFRNFPQLGMVVAGLADPAEVARRPAGTSAVAGDGTSAVAGDGTGAAAGPGSPVVSRADLAAPTHVLPSAACYGLYFALRGARLPEVSRYTFRGHCFRREAGYQGLDRLLGFTMREVVVVGAPALVDQFVERAHRAVADVAAELRVAASLEVATDPFFERDGARAKMQRLLPVKHELVSSRGVALASVNSHRNFFGERCDIRLADGGEPVSTACLGFGIERWISEVGRLRGLDGAR